MRSGEHGTKQAKPSPKPVALSIERDSDNKALGFWSILAIGVGGMVGGGIFAVLGLSVQLARGGAPIAFALAGLVALVSSYSYAKLSVRFPSQGGTVEFINRAYGTGFVTGSLNNLLWLSYVVMLSLYAYAFGSYGASFFSAETRPLFKHVFISVVIVVLTLVNAIGSKVVGELEEWIVGFKVLILLGFIGFGLSGVEFARMEPAAWAQPIPLLAGGMIIFLAYEGFELIANTARDARNPARTLPRSFYAAVGFVIVLYILVSAVTVGTLSVHQIVQAKDYALAEAAKPFLGRLGFVLIAIAAMLSTSSAINATLYGSARVSYIIAKQGELPEFIERRVWKGATEGLLITSGLTLLVANSFNLTNISMMGSAGFLLIFAAVNSANVKLHRETGARLWLCVTGAAVCLLALAALVWQTASMHPLNLLVLGGILALAFSMEFVYRRVRLRSTAHALRK